MAEQIIDETEGRYMGPQPGDDEADLRHLHDEWETRRLNSAFGAGAVREATSYDPFENLSPEQVAEMGAD